MAGALLWSRDFVTGTLPLLEPLPPAADSAFTAWFWRAGAPPATAMTGWEAGSTPEVWSCTTAGWGSTTDGPATQERQHSAGMKCICARMKCICASPLYRSTLLSPPAMHNWSQIHPHSTEQGWKEIVPKFTELLIHLANQNYRY